MRTYQSRRKNQLGKATAQQQSDVASYQTSLPIDALSVMYSGSTDPTVASPALADNSTDHLQNAMNQRLINHFGGGAVATPESPSLTEISVKTGSPDTEPLGGAKRPQSMSRFGADFNNPRAEAEADRIGKQFSNISSFDSLKEKMGEKLGADFSGVRLHHDAHSIEMNQGANAKAFTSGKDIYMGSGGFDSSIAAHEMVHTMQQGEVISTETTVIDAPSGSVQYVSERTRNTWVATARQGDRSHLVDLLEHRPNEINAISQEKSAEIEQNFQTALNSMAAQGQPIPQRGSREWMNQMATAIAPDTKTMIDLLFREGLRTSANIDETERKMLGDEMNHIVIADSMKKIDPTNSELTNDEAARTEQSGRDMAHLMLAMQLGKFTVQEEGQDPKTLDELGAELGYMPSMASMISYGGRVKMDFGKSTDKASADDVYRSMLELDGGNIGGNVGADDMAHQIKTTRWWATHNLESHDDSIEEQKGFEAAISAFTDSSMKHRGFNPAIGGAGKQGIISGGSEGHIIRADGKNGHMYLGVKNSTADTHGGMLVGLENSASGETSTIGSKHDFHAKSAPYSPVGGNKKDALGKSENGRSVDLTGLDMDEQIWLQHRLSERMDALSQQTDPTAYNLMMKNLSGEQMTPEDLAAMLCPEGERDPQYAATVELVKRGRQIPPPQAQVQG